MKSKLLFILAMIGVIGALASAFMFRSEKDPIPPAFNPAANPYSKGIYANGIIESYQSNGANINIFPEVPGVITQIAAVEGATVKKGEILIQLDDSVQRRACEQLKAQADASLAALEALKAQPRKENLEVSKAQVEYAAANVRTYQSQFEKLKKAHDSTPGSVSRDQLDNIANALKAAEASLDVARKQLELTKAGAWAYDIRNQQHQYEALCRAHESSLALLEKYAIRAPVDGIIYSVNAAPGSFISTSGAYGIYTTGYSPVIVMGNADQYLSVRCYIDEILISRLPTSQNFNGQFNARMFIRGTDVSIPLEFVRIQPYVTPKIQLSNQRAERVDVRVLPVLFRFTPPKDMGIYPGRLVDVYLESK